MHAFSKLHSKQCYYLYIHCTYLDFPSRDPGVEETEMFQTVTYNQKLLENSCLGTLWNYSELEEDRRIVLKKIGLGMFIKSLIRSPSQGHEGDLEPEVIDINDSAVGCLAQ